MGILMSVYLFICAIAIAISYFIMLGSRVINDQDTGIVWSLAFPMFFFSLLPIINVYWIVSTVPCCFNLPLFDERLKAHLRNNGE